MISREWSYHGTTLGGLAVTGVPKFREPFAPMLWDGVRHVRNTYGDTAEELASAKAVEDMILAEGPETVSAVFAEPVQNGRGGLVPPDGYWPELRRICDRYGVLLVADEVICGFGRTGKWFGSETMGMQPTSVSMAKAITSAYMPLGGISIEEDLYQAMLDQSKKIGVFGHGYTYTAHPVASAVALKTIEIYKRDGIVDHVAKLAPLFEGRFNKLKDHELIGDVRAKGFIGAAEIVENKATRASFDPKKMVGPTMMKFAQERGLMVRAMVDSVALCPPLIITESEVNEMFDRYEAALDDTAQWIKKEGLRAA